MYIPFIELCAFSEKEHKDPHQVELCAFSEKEHKDPHQVRGCYVRNLLRSIS
jgi:hypothetical protein